MPFGRNPVSPRWRGALPWGVMPGRGWRVMTMVVVAISWVVLLVSMGRVVLLVSVLKVGVEVGVWTVMAGRMGVTLVVIVGPRVIVGGGTGWLVVIVLTRPEPRFPVHTSNKRQNHPVKSKLKKWKKDGKDAANTIVWLSWLRRNESRDKGLFKSIILSL